MKWTERRERFRTILNGQKCIHPASVWDPISARIAEELGFEIGMLAGSTASLAVLGAPDMLTLTLTEFAEQAHRVSRAAHLPLLVDADHGYGNALNVRRTVEELEDAGVSGITIEDTLLPAQYGAPKSSQLICLEEATGKLKAALSARRDTSLSIIARTSAPAISGLSETLTRVNAYAQLGVDAIFLVGVRTPDELQEVHATTSLPLVLGSTEPKLSDKAMLARSGVRICLQGHLPFSAAIRGISEVMSKLRNDTWPDPSQLSQDEFTQRLIRVEEYERWISEYLGG